MFEVLSNKDADRTMLHSTLDRSYCTGT